MPRGAKKRKAAMKKKQKEATTSSNISSSTADIHGDEDLKRHESDGDRNSENNFSEGEEEGVVEKSRGVEQNESLVDEKNGSDGVEKRVGEDEGVVQIEGELKPDDGFDTKNGGSSSGSSGDSSSSSSDDESRDVEKDIKIVGNAPVVDIVEAVDSLPEGTTHTTPVIEISDYDKEAGPTHTIPVVIEISDSDEEAANGFDAEKVTLLDEKLPVYSSASAENSLVSEVLESLPGENEEKKLSSLEDGAGLVDVVEDLAPEVKNDAVTAENSLVSEVEESVVIENEDKKLNSLEDSARLVEVVKDLAPEQKKDEVISAAAASDEDANAAAASYVIESVPASDVEESLPASDVKESVATSDVKVSAVHPSEDKLIPPSDAPTDDAIRNDEHVKDSGVLGASDPLASSAPRQVQTTSWMSCCGLFEALAGSNR